MTTVAVAVGRSFRNLNTLQTLKLSRAVIVGLDGLLLLAIVMGAHVHRAAMQTVGKDAAPSIVAAQHIKAALADMDADEANEMLAPPNTANAATAGMAKRAPEADEALLAAAGKVTYEAEYEPIKTLQVTGGIYNRLVQQAEDMHDGGSPDYVNAYRADAIIMDNDLLPAADDLDRANNRELQRTYHEEATGSTLTTILVALTGMAALAALIWLQVYLSRRTRRTVNPPLALATLLLLGLAGYTLSALVIEQHQLKVAEEDAFESVHALWRARAVAYQANAEESRFLLDPEHAGDYTRAFADETALLVKKPAGMSYGQLVSTEASGAKVDGFTGYLADELNNITFKGEQSAALRTLAAFGEYMRVDGEIRRLEHAGQHQQAVTLCVGSEPGQSDYVFDQFDKALGETLAINQREFERAVDSGLSAVGSLSGKLTAGEILSTLEFKGVVLAGLIAGLVVLGFAPRIKEYD